MPAMLQKKIVNPSHGLYGRRDPSPCALASEGHHGKASQTSRTPDSEIHSDTIAIWRNIFERTGISGRRNVIDLCPGDDPKIETALDNLGFRGSLIAVDASNKRLAALQSGIRDPSFRFVPCIARLEDLKPADCDAIVANHPIDDLAVSFFAGKHGMSYDDLYRRCCKDAGFSAALWERIVSDSWVGEQVVSLLSSIASRIPYGAFFIIGQYPSRYERQHSMESETEFCADTLGLIRKRLIGSGRFAEDTLTADAAVPAGPVHRSAHWLILRKNDTIFRSLEFRLTGRCNLLCSHCCAHSASREDMGLSLLRKAAAELKGTNCRIGFTGGEPLLFRRLPEALEIFSAASDLCITTNGTVDRDDAMSIFARSGAKVKVSIHGEREGHDLITGVKGSFDKTVSFIRKLLEAGVRVAVQTNLHRSNIASAKERIDLCHSLGVNELNVFPLIDQGRARSDIWTGSRLSAGSFHEALADMRQRAEAIRWGGFIRAIEWPNGGQYVLMSQNGDVSANPLDLPEGSLVIGNAVRQSLGEIWGAYPFKEAHALKYSGF